MLKKRDIPTFPILYYIRIFEKRGTHGKIAFFSASKWGTVPLFCPSKRGTVGKSVIIHVEGFKWRHIKQILQLILVTAMFVSSLYGIVLENTTKCCYFLFRSYQNNQITTEWQEYQHTLYENFKNFHEVNREVKHFLLFSPYWALQEGNKEM